MPGITARPAGREVKCPHCWGTFFSKSQSLFISSTGGFVSPEHVADWDAPSDPSGRPLQAERACPHCKIKVSTRLLETNSLFISIVGTPSSGKTYFLASMYYKAKEQLASVFRQGISFPGVSGELVSRYFEKLTGNGMDDELVDLPKTQEGGFELYTEITSGSIKLQYPKPFTMRITDPVRKDPLAIVTYDNAGESYLKASNLDATTKSIDHLEHCNLIIVVIDPVQMPKLAAELVSRGVGDPQLSARTGQSQDQVLNSVLDRTVGLRGSSESNLLDTPVCVVMQKWDMLDAAGIVPSFERTDPATGKQTTLLDDSPLNVHPDTGETYVDDEEMRAISLLVRETISNYEPNIVNTLTSSFKTVRYFACSALGSSPEVNPKNGKLGFRPKNIRPFRITDPLLWFLAKEGILDSSVASKNQTEYPYAQKLKRLSGSQFQIQSPHDPTNWIDVDSEYLKCEYDTIAPDLKSGKWFRIRPKKYWRINNAQASGGYTIFHLVQNQPVNPNSEQVSDNTAEHAAEDPGKRNKKRRWRLWGSK